MIAKDAGVEITTSQPRRIEPVSFIAVAKRDISPGGDYCAHHRNHHRAWRFRLCASLLFYMFLFGGWEEVAVIAAGVWWWRISAAVAVDSADSAEAARGVAAREVAGRRIEGTYGS